MTMPDKSREERRNAVIDVLNQARAMELFAIQQYMNQHYNLDDMDYGDLAAKVKLFENRIRVGIRAIIKAKVKLR